MSARPCLYALLILSATLAACSDDKDSSNDSGAVGDDSGTGDDSSEVTYDEGCILVDGGGGYAYLADAVTVADPGATITLCEGTVEESVTVDKAVNIVGAGTALTTLSAPTNLPALIITADGVSLSGVAVESTRSAIQIVGASDMTIDDVLMSNVANYGIDASGAENLTISASTFIGVGYGAVLCSGGSATVSGSTFTDNISFGIKASDGATLIAEDNTITGSVPPDPEATEITDGHGIWLVESSGELARNVLEDNYFIGIYADGSDLSLDGDSVARSLYGVAAVLGAFSATGVVATDNYFHGVFVVNNEGASVTDTTVTGAADLVVDVAADSWSTDTYVGVGLYLVAPVVTVNNASVTGYNNAGLLVTPYDSECDATLTDVDLVDNGRVGLYVSGADLVANNVNISGVLDLEDYGDDQCYSVGVNAAATLIQSNVEWNGGSLASNDGYGMAALYSVLAMDGGSVSGNSCAGIMNFGGVMVVQNADFSDSRSDSFQGSIVSYEGAEATIVNNSFHDAQTWRNYYTYEYDDGAGNIYEYHYYQYDGSDIQLWYGGDNLIQGNSFVDGSTGIYLAVSDATIEDNAWSNYQGNVIYAYGDGAETATLNNNVVDGFNGYGVLCSSVSMDIDGLTLLNGGSYSSGVDAYLNDEPYYSYTSTSAQPVFYGSTCTWSSQDVEIENTDGHVMFNYGGDYVIDGLTATDVSKAAYSGYDAIYFYGYYDAEAWLTDVTINNVASGGGVGLISYTTGVDLALHLDGVTIDGTTEHGVSMERSSSTYTTPTVDLTDVTISDTTQHGVYLYGAEGTLDGVTIKDAGSSGLYMTTATATATGLSIDSAASYGVYASSSTLTLNDSEITNSGLSGIYLSGCTGSVESNVVTSSANYGMLCSSTTFDACSNDLSGNTSGEQSGCDASCAGGAE